MSMGSPVRIVAFSKDSSRHHNGVNHIRRFGETQQPPGIVRIALPQGNNLAPGQEPPELSLLWGAADLGDHRRGNQGKDAKFQTGLVFSPYSPLAYIGGHQNGGVVDDGAHAGRRAVRGIRS
jgi:hypothetical protein